MTTIAEQKAQHKYRSRPEIKQRIRRQKLDKLKLERQKAVTLLGGVCCVCKRKSMRYLHFHHLSYPNGNPYKTHKSTYTAYKATIKEALQNPDNFRLVCKPCHDAIGVAVSVPGAYERLRELIELTLERRQYL